MDNVNNQTPKRATNNTWRWGIIIAIVVITAFLIYLFSIDAPKGSQDMGLDGYTQEELNKMYPQIKNADIPTRKTPEETYATLKEALKNEDVETATNCFAEDVREEWGDNLQEIKDKGYMQEMEQDLTELKLELEGEGRITYTFDNIDSVGDVIPHHISFIKDSNGDWKIKSL